MMIVSKAGLSMFSCLETVFSLFSQAQPKPSWIFLHCPCINQLSALLQYNTQYQSLLKYKTSSSLQLQLLAKTHATQLTSETHPELSLTWHSSIPFIIDVVGDDELDDSLEDEGNPSLENGNFQNLLILDDYEDDYDDEDDDDYVSGEL